MGIKAPVARFAGPDGHADCTVLTVTYRNAATVDAMVAGLRACAADVALRVVVVDNRSDDATLELLRRHDDLVLVDSGGNLGYAGGLNVGREHAGDTGAVLYLNPDVELDGAAVRRMLTALAEDGVGAVVPRMPGPDGQFVPSLRREPSLRRALGDALFGERFAARPGTWSEIVHDRARYEHPCDVDWAAGAAIMVRRDADARVGPWDERFFLYSEEVDLCARIRALGLRIRYVPDAVARHAGGASGASPALEALMAVNRVRYYEKHHGRLPALAYRGLVTLHETLRVTRGPGHRAALRAVVDRRAWRRLPAATRAGDPVVVR